MATFPRDIVIDNGRYSIPVWVRNGLKGLREFSQSPGSLFVAGGGAGKYGDAEPGFAFMEQRDWSGGRGLDFFGDDQTRYNDSKGTWSLTPGKIGPAPQWFFGSGYRPGLSEFDLPGNVTWRPLYGGTQYVDRLITPSATITADKAAFWIRRVGTPQSSLTFELCSDDTGSPDTVLKSATVSTSTITDLLSVFYEFDFTGTQSLTGSTPYHLKIYGGDSDTRDGHWEVAVDSTNGDDGLYSEDGSSWTIASYAPYYRVVGEDIKAYHMPFYLDEVLYWVSIYRDGTSSRVWMNGKRGVATSTSATTLTDSGASFGSSSEYVGARVRIIRGKGAGQSRSIVSHTGTALTVSTWDITPDTTSQYIIYKTPRYTEVTTTGLGVVTDVTVLNNIAYFAQGEATNIRKMRFNPATPAHEFTDDGTNKASLLTEGYYADTPVAVLWRANNDATAAGANTVSRANAAAWGGSHSFGTAIKVGNGNYPITNIIDGSNDNASRLFVFKTGENGFVQSDKWYRDNVDIAAFPEATNGLAAKVHGLYKFSNWSWSLERQYGNAIDDLDPNREAGFPPGRQGYISAVESHPVGVLLAIDAGDTGTSSVQFFDGFNYHEIFRAPGVGKRIRSLIWQPNAEDKKFLWISCGDDLIYMEFPRHHRDPYKDDTQKFMHEFSFVSATYDMTNSSIYKVWKDIRFVTKNLSGADGIKLRLDYQLDNNIGTDNWLTVLPDTNADVATVSQSPSQTVKLYIGGSQQLRYRIRGYTTDATVPPIINGITVKGVGQMPIKYVATFWANFGPVASSLGAANENAVEIVTDAARTATVWTIDDCVYKRLIGRRVLVSIGQINPDYTTDERDNAQVQMQLVGLDD